MTMLRTILTSICLAVAVAGSAFAFPATYTFEGTGGGSITDAGGGITGFAGDFKFVFFADTTAIDTSAAPFYYLHNVGGTFTEGAFSATLTATNTIVASADPSLELINFFNSSVLNGLGGKNADLNGYDLSTSIGPLTLDPLTPTFLGGCFATTDGGCIEMTSDRTLTFEARVPEPATLAILGLGLAGLGVMRRRRAA